MSHLYLIHLMISGKVGLLPYMRIPILNTFEVNQITRTVVNVVIMTPSMAWKTIGLLKEKLSAPITFILRIIIVGVKKGISDRVTARIESGS
jgi:hypothetical protein